VVGLKRTGTHFLYNPSLTSPHFDHAIVLSSPQRLKELCDLKLKRGVSKLLAGPNIVVRPGDADQVLLNSVIDLVLVPSDWVKDLYVQDGPLQEDRVAVWASGVDETWWKPWGEQARTDIVIYDKYMPEMASQVECLLAQLGLKHRVIRYGEYSPGTYRAALNSAVACIFLTESESQGLALAEAWSMDVPTLVLQRQTRVINGLHMTVSTAPYLTDLAGHFWQDLDQLRGLLGQLAVTKHEPRLWVLSNMTDVACAKNFLDILEALDA